MKVLGIVCSPRTHGNTEILVQASLAKAQEEGAEIELVTLAGKTISPCDACSSCRKTGKCHIKDDMQDIYTKLLEADGIIFGTPVYFWNVTAQAKTLIDRTYVLMHTRSLRNKVAVAIVVARRTGAAHAFSALHDFFNIQMMVPAGVAAFTKEEESKRSNRMGEAAATGGGKGEVKQDTQGIAEVRALGELTVKTIQRLGESGLL